MSDSLGSCRALVSAALAVFAVGCAGVPKPAPIPKGLHAPFAGYVSARYAADAGRAAAGGPAWICRPDMLGGPCREDQTTTELRPDGTQVVVPQPLAAAEPAVDCFYVYPTVDLSIRPGNHTDARDRRAIDRVVRAQIAQFGRVCRLFVPFYRQVTIGTYFGGTPRERDQRLAVAFSDVLDAFADYMSHRNEGRKVVLIGHSQGAEMVVRLIKTVFDHDPDMRARLLVAMPIGGEVEVRAGKTTGGTFDTIPVCTSADETGCVIAYRTYLSNAVPRRADDAPRRGDETVCVNPAASGPGPAERWFSRPIFLADGAFKKVARTPYVAIPDFYAGRCINGTEGFRFLGVALAPAPGDRRKNLIDFGSFWLTTPLGLHVLDLQFAQGDLIDLVAHKAAVAAVGAGSKSAAVATP